MRGCIKIRYPSPQLQDDTYPGRANFNNDGVKRCENSFLWCQGDLDLGIFSSLFTTGMEERRKGGRARFPFSANCLLMLHIPQQHSCQPRRPPQRTGKSRRTPRQRRKMKTFIQRGRRNRERPSQDSSDFDRKKAAAALTTFPIRAHEGRIISKAQ